MEGISVVIVCHNGAERLPRTLSHLRVQEPARVPWELLLIDNASTDHTAEVARSCWYDAPAPLRVVRESRLGVRYARERGLAEAKYTFVGFVDDDNWVAPDWVHVAYETISSDSHLGAIGSVRDPACEVASPPWFENFHSIYAVLTERDLEDMPQQPTYLPTGGLCIRKAAWQELVRDGFHSLLPEKPQRAEDTELTLALHLSGWKLKIDPRLRLQHFVRHERLRWSYLRHLERENAECHVFLDGYTEYSLCLRPGVRRWLSERWWYQLSKSLIRIVNRPTAALAALSSAGEGHNEAIDVERQFGRVLGLLRLRGRYRALRREVRGAPWRCGSRPKAPGILTSFNND
jgi:glycosyltransferase involved in cell wall biosynthesis